MPLGPFDRDRIETDIDQAEEMITRTQWLIDQTTDAGKKALLIIDLEVWSNRLAQLKTLLP